MKKIVSLFIALSAMIATLSAQFYVEGSSRVRYTDRSIASHETPLLFNVSALTGYQLNNRIAAGAKMSFAGRREKIMVPEPNTGGSVEMVIRSPEWSFAVFGRYKLLGAKKISFLIECSGYVSEKKEIYNIPLPSIGERMDNTVKSIGIKMLPLVTYDFSNKFSLITRCDFLSFDWSSKTETFMRSDEKYKRNHFGLTAQSNIFSYLEYIRIGFIYHFNKSSQ